MASERVVDRLPLLHKYVLQPQDDLQLVLTKLNYRLCVKEVSKVIYRRSLGASISEAVDLIEASAEMNGHPEVEPLALSDEGPQCVSSPKTLSPDDSYCGTMKSDDSGIVMDESHMNFSGDHSDLMFSSTEVSPLEEENHILNGVKTAYLDDIREGSSSPVAVCEEEEIEAESQQHFNTEDQVKEFFTGSPDTNETTEDPETKLEIQVEEIKASSSESQEATPIITEDQSESCLESSDLSDELPQTNEQEQPVDEEETESEIKPEELEEEKPESETVPEEEEEERVEFVKDLDADTGIRCDDVYTAIQILKTRYKLSDTTVRKFIITFSAWDVSQISHPISNRCSWWDDSQHVPADSTEMEDLTENIYTRQGEISELVDRIMEEEQVKHDMMQKLKKQKEEQEKDEFVAAPEEFIEPTQAPEIETVPSKNEDDNIEEADHMNDEEAEPSDEKDSKNNKKKNRNAWQRFVHALRKRMRRNSSRTPPPTEKDRAKA